MAKFIIQNIYSVISINWYQSIVHVKLL